LNHARTTLARLVSAAKSAVQQGNLAIGAASAAEASLAGIDASRDTIAQQAQTDHAQLAKLLGVAPDVAIPVAAPQDAPLPAARVRALVATIARRRPDLIALRYGYSAADADLRAQIRAQFPLISLTVNGGTDTTRVASAGPTITLDLPIFNDNRGNIAVARATRRQLAAAFRAALDGAANDAEAAAQALALLRREQRRAESRLDAAQLQAREARRAYAQGLIDARVETNLLDQAVTRETQMIVLRQKLDTGLISLRTLLGAGLPTAPAPAGATS
jgi:outer membrane protein TolC